MLCCKSFKVGADPCVCPAFYHLDFYMADPQVCPYFKFADKQVLRRTDAILPFKRAYITTRNAAFRNAKGGILL